MNVDLIKFVNDDNTITIFTTEEYWQYLYSMNNVNLRYNEIYLIETYGCGIIEWPNICMGDMIEILLEKQHMSKIVNMVEIVRKV